MEKTTFYNWIGRLSYLVMGMFISYFITLSIAQDTLYEVNNSIMVETYNAGCNQGLYKGLDWDPIEFQKQYVFCQDMSKTFSENYQDISLQVKNIQNQK